MDGNGRWAESMGKPRILGHKYGAKSLKNIIRACPKYGITHLTVYAFSTENWTRSTTEVQGLMLLFQWYLEKYTHKMHQEGIQLRIIGNSESLNPVLQEQIRIAEEKTQNNTRLVLQIALNYGGQDDLLQATQHLIAQYQSLNMDPKTLTKQDLAEALWTKECPDPDLLIRTGGEVRLSNYMMWQLSYTELMFLSEYWPDFTPQHLERCVTQFRSRKRRFGGTPDAAPV